MNMENYISQTGKQFIISIDFMRYICHTLSKDKFNFITV